MFAKWVGQTGQDEVIQVLDVWAEERAEEIFKSDMPTDIKDTWEIELADVKETAHAVYLRWEQWFRPDDWDPIFVEKPLTYEIENSDVEFWAIVDFVGRDKDGVVHLTDWKVPKALTDPDRNPYPLQLMSYAYLLKEMGIEVDRIGNTQIIGLQEGVPKVNKDESLSRAKIRTTWETYRAKVILMGLNVDDYAEMEEKLSTFEWFRVQSDTWSAERLDAVWNNVIVPSAKRLAARHAKMDVGEPTAFGSWMCAQCDFREICVADMFGDEFMNDGKFEVTL